MSNTLPSIHYRFIIALLVSLFVMSACSQSGEKSTVNLEAADEQRSHNTNAGAEILNENVSSNTVASVNVNTLDNVEGKLVYTSATTLYLQTIGDNAPTIIAEAVLPTSVVVVSDSQMVLYATQTSDSYRLYATDLLSNKTTALTDQLYTTAPIFRSISPDGQWVLISLQPRDNQFLVSHLDGTSSFAFAYAEGNFGLVWLEDSTLFAHGLGVREQAESRGSTTVTFVFDPETDTRTAINFGLDHRTVYSAMQQPERYTTLSSFTKREGLAAPLAYKWNRDVAIMPDLTANFVIEKPQSPNGFFGTNTPPPSVCEVWSVVRKPMKTIFIPENLYTISDTALLSDIRLLPDGSLMFVRWSTPRCSEAENAEYQVELVHVTADGTIEVVSNTLASTERPNLSYGGFQDIIPPSGIYTLSPDGRYAVWIGSDATNGSKMLELTDLQTDTTVQFAMLSSEELPTISGIYWIPA